MEDGTTAHFRGRSFGISHAIAAGFFRQDADVKPELGIRFRASSLASGSRRIKTPSSGRVTGSGVHGSLEYSPSSDYKSHPVSPTATMIATLPA